MKYFLINEDFSSTEDVWIVQSEKDLWFELIDKKKEPSQINIEITSDGFRNNLQLVDYSLMLDSKAKMLLESLQPASFSAVKFTPKIDEAYFFVISLKDITCVDEKKSVFELYDKDNAPNKKMIGRYYDFEKLVIDTSRVPKDLHIFRIDKYEAIIISEELKNAFQKNKLEGLSYTRV